MKPIHFVIILLVIFSIINAFQLYPKPIKVKMTKPDDFSYQINKKEDWLRHESEFILNYLSEYEYTGRGNIVKETYIFNMTYVSEEYHPKVLEELHKALINERGWKEIPNTRYLNESLKAGFINAGSSKILCQDKSTILLDLADVSGRYLNKKYNARTYISLFYDYNSPCFNRANET